MFSAILFVYQYGILHTDTKFKKNCTTLHLFIKNKSENTKFHFNHLSNCNNSATATILNVVGFSAGPKYNYNQHIVNNKLIMHLPNAPF